MQISVAAPVKSKSEASTDEAERGPPATARHPLARMHTAYSRSPVRGNRAACRQDSRRAAPLLTPTSGSNGFTFPEDLLLRKVLSLCCNTHSSVHTSALWVISLLAASCHWIGRWGSSPGAQRTPDERTMWINRLSLQGFTTDKAQGNTNSLILKNMIFLSVVRKKAQGLDNFPVLSLHMKVRINSFSFYWK